MAEEEPLLFSQELQMGEEKRALPMKLGEAVAKGIIANQTLAYFIGRTFTFLKRMGLNPEVLFPSYSPAIGCSSCAGADAAMLSDLDVALGQDHACCRCDVSTPALQRVRFRQHLQHEMAHYAEDCWDAEVDCTYGWVECVGLADRSAFDLRVSGWWDCPSASLCACPRVLTRCHWRTCLCRLRQEFA